MFGVQYRVAVVREQIGRGDLAARVCALFGKAQDKATGVLHTRSTRIDIVNVTIKLYVLHEVSISVGDHLAAVLWVAERWTR